MTLAPALAALLAAAAPDGARLDATALDMVAALRDGHSVRAVKAFDAALRAELPPPRLTAAWRTLVGAFGAPGAATVERARSPGGAERAYDVAFERGHVALDVAFSPAGEITSVAFHPRLGAATAPAGAEAREIAAGERPLLTRATLVLPRRAGARTPAALLLGDLGADRDGARGPGARPLADLAAALAARGVASLRLDRHEVAYPDPGAASTPHTEFVADAAAALRLLRGLPEIDASRLYVVGHGLGGVLAGDVARRGGPVAAVALVGAPAFPYALALLEAARAPGALSPGERAREEALGQRALAGALDDDERYHGYGGSFWRGLAGVDARGTLRRLGEPVLVARGERDTVARAEDAQAWRAALAGVAAATVEALPGVDHDLAGPEPHHAAAVGRIAEFLRAAPPTGDVARAAAPASP